MKYTSIIVDDSPQYVENIYNALSEVDRVEILGYAESGKEAVENLEKMNLFPNIVTIDGNMEDEDGYNLFLYLRKKKPKTKVIVITNRLNNRLYEKTIALNPEGFITKPFQPTELIEVVQRIIKELDGEDRKTIVSVPKTKAKLQLKITKTPPIYIVGKRDGPMLGVKDIKIINKDMVNYSNAEEKYNKIMEPTIIKKPPESQEDIMEMLEKIEDYKTDSNFTKKPAFITPEAQNVSQESIKKPAFIETEDDFLGDDDDFSFSIEEPNYKIEGSKKVYKSSPEKIDIKVTSEEMNKRLKETVESINNTENPQKKRLIPRRAEEIFKPIKEVTTNESSPDDVLFISRNQSAEIKKEKEKDEDIIIAIRPPKAVEGMEDDFSEEDIDFYNPPKLTRKEEKKKTRKVKEKGLKSLFRKLFK